MKRVSRCLAFCLLGQLEIAALRRDVETLESDPAALERAIREDLVFARPGEVVVRLPSAVPTNPRIP